MTVEQLQQLAFDSGLKVSAPYTSKIQLIRNIQLLRGKDPCFSSERRYFCTDVCEWSSECRKLRAQWAC